MYALEIQWHADIKFKLLFSVTAFKNLVNEPNAYQVMNITGMGLETYTKTKTTIPSSRQKLPILYESPFVRSTYRIL
jgi:hypothetical protein